MPTIVALGEMLIDFAPVAADAAGYPTLKAQPGGAPCNFLAALQKYGCSTAMIGKVGDDRFGRLLIQTAADCGIETRGIIKDAAAFTTMAFVTLDAEGNREFSFARKPGADTCLTEHEVDYSLIDTCRVFHFGTLSLTDEPARTATQKAVAYAKTRGKLISFDPNLRKPLWPDDAAAATQMEWGLHQADIVKISDEEVDFLWHTTPAAAAQKLLREYGVRLVYVTMGPGVLFCQPQRQRHDRLPHRHPCVGYHGSRGYLRRKCHEPAVEARQSPGSAVGRGDVRHHPLRLLRRQPLHPPPRRNQQHPGGAGSAQAYTAGVMPKAVSTPNSRKKIATRYSPFNLQMVSNHGGFLVSPLTFR